MKFRVPAIFSDEFISNIEKLNRSNQKAAITEIYGSLDEGIVGNARVSTQSKKLTYEYLSHYIKLSKAYNISFNYVLNTTCLGNLEFAKSGIKQIGQYMDQLIECGITAITVAHPFLLQFIKKRHPTLEVVASINFCADNIIKIQQLEEFGADRVVLNRWINRDFKVLKKLIKESNIELELLLNSGCVKHCILHNYHNNVNSHFSQNGQSGDDVEKMLFKYPGFVCLNNKLKDILQFICSAWIRPEDLEFYEAIGINSFKMDLRGASEEKILNISKAYLSKSFNGNFFYLLLPTEDHPGLIDRKNMCMQLNSSELD